MSAPPSAQSPDQPPARPVDRHRGKKPYRSPRLVEWGTLTDLTQGPQNNFQDGFFSGSGAT